jgi:hypothetical protein
MNDLHAYTHFCLWHFSKSCPGKQTLATLVKKLVMVSLSKAMKALEMPSEKYISSTKVYTSAISK